MKWLQKKYIKFRILLLKYKSCIQKVYREGDVVTTKFSQATLDGEVPIFLDEFKVIENINAVWNILEASREREVSILFTVRGRLFMYYTFVKRKGHLEESDYFVIIYFLKYIWLLIGHDKRKKNVMQAILKYYIYLIKKRRKNEPLEIREDLIDEEWQ